MNAVRTMMVAIAATGVAVSLAACGGGSSSMPSSAQQVVKQKKQKPSVVVKTKTVTVETTPQACRDAMKYAVQSAHVASDFAGTAAQFPPLVGKAYEAGATSNLVEGQSVLASMHRLTGEYKSEALRLHPIVQHFNAARAECLSK